MSNGGHHFLRRAASAAAMGLLLAFASVGSASAQSCQEDFQRLSNARMAAIQSLNNLGKAGKGKMDPMAACPAAKRLAGVEAQMLAYMTKNKDWCSIPDNVIDGFKAARAKTQGFASQACSVAAKVQMMKKQQMQQQQQAGPGGGMPVQKLPSGPL